MKVLRIGAILLVAAGCGDSSPTDHGGPPPDKPEPNVGPAGGTVHSADGRVTITVPAGALPTPILITVEAVTPEPSDPALVQGTTYRFGPEGTVFAQPVRISIQYHVAGIPGGFQETSLELYELGADWQVVPGSTVDLSAESVTGSVTHFSVFAVRAGLAECLTSGAPFSWPVCPEARDQLGQDYAQWDLGSREKYHAGLDIARSGATLVVAAAGGTVILVQENHVGCGSGPGQCRDHGYGNTVVLRHEGDVFTQYSHLEFIDQAIRNECGPVDGATRRTSCSYPVPNGTVLGAVGCTRYGLSECGEDFGAHLHFEVKRFSTLGTINDDNGDFGYTLSAPEDSGYLDPMTYLHSVEVSVQTEVVVRPEGDSVRLRIGPDSLYRALRIGRSGERFRARRQSERSDGCSMGWYQVYLPDGTEFEDTSRPAKSDPSKYSTIPDTWVCRGDAGVRWVSEPGQPDLTVAADPAAQLESGQTGVGVPVRVLRSGGLLVNGSYVTARLYWSDDTILDAADVQLWESDGANPDYPNTVLNSTGSHTVTATVDIPVSVPGPYYVLAVVDPTDFHPEANEENNLSSYAVSVAAQTLDVELTASPQAGVPPLVTTLTADVSGTASGTINYTFWWDCTDAGTSVSGVAAICGDPTDAATGAKFDGVTDDPKAVSHTYAGAGDYTAKVIVERGTASPADARVTITAVPSGSIVVGDTVHGTIDPVGNIDDFVFDGSTGQEIAAFLQTLSGGFFNNLELCVLADAGTFDEITLGCVRSNGDDVTLWDQSTGLLKLPRSTTYTVQVRGLSGDGGPYRFQIFPIDRAPEVQPQALVFNDTIDGELIRPLGDVDEFKFTGDVGQEVAVFLRTLSGGFFNDLEACLVADAHTLDQMELGCTRSNGDDATLWGQSTGRFSLPRATTYTVRVVGVPSATDQGPYRIMVYLVDRAPEVKPSALVFNDTIDGESIGPPGDIDEFTFPGTPDQEVSAFLRTLTGGFFNDLEVCLVANAGTLDEAELGCERSNGDDASLWGQTTGRFQLPLATIYTVRVLGVDSAEDQGPYRTMAQLVDRAPEVAPQDLVLDDTVDIESLEPPGDIDEFTFAGKTGQEVAAFLQTLSGGFFNDMTLCVVADAGTLDELQLGCVRSNGDDVTLWDQSTGRLSIPRNTTYSVRVFGTQNDADFGPYRFMAHLVDRSPEQLPAAVTVGDTVSGEAIKPPGDVDEFTFSGNAGETVEVFFQALSGGFFERLELNLLRDAGTGSEQRLGSRALSDGNDTSLEHQSTGPVVLPITGSYTLRIVGLDSKQGEGAYRFHVRR